MTIRIVTPLSLYRCRNLLNLRLDETKIICYTSLNYLNNLYYCVSKRKVPFWSARCSKYLNAVLYTYSLCVCLHAHDYNNFTDTKCRNEYTFSTVYTIVQCVHRENQPTSRNNILKSAHSTYRFPYEVFLHFSRLENATCSLIR